MSWAKLGDAIHVLVLFLASVYAIFVYGHGSGWWVAEAFGQNWARDGFCLSFKGSFVHTHLLCFYGDAVFTLILIYLTSNTTRPELIPIKQGAPSVFFHGVAHGLIWVNEQYGYGMPGPGKVFFDLSMPPLLLGVSSLGVFGFWVSFLCMQRSPIPAWFNITQSVIHTIAVGWAVPVFLLFCYVNTVLFFNIAGAALLFGLEARKDKFYCASACLVSLPIMLSAWAEPLLCDRGLIHWGGHILFDYTIPVSQIIYIFVACMSPPRPHTKKE